MMQIRAKLKDLKLSNKAVWDREHAREAAGGGVDTPWYVRAVYYSLCLFLDVAFDNRCGWWGFRELGLQGSSAAACKSYRLLV